VFKPRIFGKYLLFEELGFGGIGEVYKAKTFGAGGYQNLVAVKTIRTVFSEEKQVVELFKNEAILSLSLSHANIIRVFDYGKVKDRHYIAMEYIHGQDVRSILKRTLQLGLKFPIEFAIEIILEVCKGLEYIHNKKDPRDASLNIVHRDISPSNILVSYPGEVKIIDFGVARVAKDEPEEAEEFFMGKLKYASPEQVSLKKIDRRSDIFAAGILFYEMLTSQNPFSGDTEIETVTQIKDAKFEIPSVHNPDVPKELEEIVGKALAKEPIDRYQTAGIMGEALFEYKTKKGFATTIQDIVAFMEKIFQGEIPLEEKSDQDDKDSTIIVESEKLMMHEDRALKKAATDEFLARIKKEKKNVATLALEVVDLDPQLVKMEAEEIAAIMNEVFKRVIDVIYRFEGQIDKLMEKQLLAIFGVPNSHDNDVERAIISGLSILNYIRSFSEELKININIKLSVDYGDAIVDYSSSDVNSYSVRGKPVDSVDQMMRIVPVNQLMGGLEISKYESAGFYFENAGSYFSHNHQIPYFRVEDRREAKREALEHEAQYTKFIGRSREFAKLYSLFCQAKEGVGQVISIYGDVGIGKSRLVYEFIRKVAHENVLAIESNARPIVSKFITSDISYSLLLILIKKIAKIDDEDSEGLVKNKLLSLTDYGISKNDIYLISTLFSIGFKESNVGFIEGDQLKKELFQSLKRLFTGISKVKNLVIIFDDIQWADPASHEFIDFFIRNVTQKNIMTLCIERKDSKIKRWDDLENYNVIEIGPLTSPESLSLLEDQMPAMAHVNRDFLYNVMEQSEGNPLFIEEIAKAYRDFDFSKVGASVPEGGTEAEVKIPRTLQGIVSARLDRLDNKTKAVLRYASVIGKNFRKDVIARVTQFDATLKKEIGSSLEESLDKLLAEGLLIVIYEREDMLEYTFKHSMTYEVVYNSMVEEMLKEVHGMVGESIEFLYGDRIEEYYEILANHFELAANLDKCIHYYELSGDKLAKAYINKEALDCYHKCVFALKKEAELTNIEQSVVNQKLSDIYYKAGMIYYYSSDWDRGLKIFNLALKAARQAGSRRRHAISLYGSARIYKAMGNYELSLKLLSEALEIVLRTQDSNLAVEIKREIGGIYYFIGNIERAVGTIEEGLSEALHLKNEPIISRYHNDLGMIYCKMEKFEEALKSFYESLKFKEKFGDKYGVGVTLGNIVDIYYTQQNYKEALKYGAAALKTTREIDDSWGIAINLHNLGNIYLKMDQFDKARESFKESLDISQEINWDVGAVLNNMFYDYLVHREGVIEKGVINIQNHLVKAEKMGTKESVARGNYLLGLLYFERSKKKDVLMAKDYFKIALQMADELGIKDLIESIKEKLG
jgi:serine/threonine protein kinase/predicted ATPase